MTSILLGSTKFWDSQVTGEMVSQTTFKESINISKTLTTIKDDKLALH
jgi:hypothetical protein